MYYTPLYKNPLRYMVDDTIPIRSFQQTFELLGIVSMIFVRYSEVNGNWPEIFSNRYLPMKQISE